MIISINLTNWVFSLIIAIFLLCMLNIQTGKVEFAQTNGGCYITEEDSHFSCTRSNQFILTINP